MLAIGLTGGIATGKSTAAAALRALGVLVVDADQVARQVVAVGSEGLAAVVARFGERVLLPDGALDRKGLGRLVVADAAARKELEGITHPRIRAAIAAQRDAAATAGEPVLVVEAALLVETGSWQHYDELWVVSCRPELQLARLMAREGLAEEQARAWLATQLPLADKEAVATRVIRNDADVAALRSAVAHALQAALSAS